MADYNLNFASAIIKESEVQYTRFNVQNIRYACTCIFHASGKNKGHTRVDHATYTCTLVIIMYRQSCYVVPLPLRHTRHPPHVITPHHYVIDIYSTCMY